MNQLLAFFIFLLLLAGFSFKNKADKADTFADPPKEISSDSARKMMKQFVLKAKKEDHAFTKFNRTELINILKNMSEDTVKFVMGAYMDDVKGPRKGKPVIMMQIKTTRPVPGGSQAALFSYLEGALCPPPDSPPCSSQLEN